MKKYKPIKGETSKKMAEKFLSANTYELNENETRCPLAGEMCDENFCAAWKPAEVYLKNPGRLHEHQSIYDIRLGRCNSPLITGKIQVLK